MLSGGWGQAEGKRRRERGMCESNNNKKRVHQQVRGRVQRQEKGGGERERGGGKGKWQKNLTSKLPDPCEL